MGLPLEIRSELEQSPEIGELMSHASITSITHYPIKGCAGVDSDTASVLRTGIKNDRRMMLVYPDGRFVSQREKDNVKMALIQPKFTSENLLHIEAFGMTSFDIEVSRNGIPFEASVHSTKGIMVVDQGKDAEKWFSEFLGYPVRLVTMAAGYERQVSQRWSTNPDDSTNFADGYPILLTSEESLDDLNGRLPQSIPMSRFRPNIVIAGGGIAYGEEQLRKIKIGNITMDLVKLCTRCVVPSGHQFGKFAGTRDSRDDMKG